MGAPAEPWNTNANKGVSPDPEFHERGARVETHSLTGPQLVHREAEARAVLRVCLVAHHRLVTRTHPCLQ